MKKLNIFFLFFLAINISLHAQTKKVINTLLWEISGNGLTKPSYLFGTHHLTSIKFVDTMKVLQQKLNAAEAVVGEIVLDSTVQTKMAPFLTMKNNTLDSLLTKAEYKEVNDYLKTKNPNIDLKQLNTFKPAMVNVMLMILDDPNMKEDMGAGMDTEFQNYARKNSKSLIGLETAEYQAALLFGDDLQKQKKALLKSVREGDKNKIRVRQLKTYYLSQNVDKLTGFFKVQDEETKEFMTELLKNRNNRWLEQLPTLMQKQSLFIAVGAGHLFGTDGLIKGLQAKNYTVKPIATN